MAKLTCLIKNTQIVDDIKLILRTAAQLEITQGHSFSIAKAYGFLRNNNVEVDLESVGAIYEDIFDLNDDHFTEKAKLDKIVGASFKQTIDNLVAMQPNVTQDETGILAPAAQVAKTLAGVFRSTQVTDVTTRTLMKEMQDALEKGARRVAQRAATQAGLQNKTAAANASFETILKDALTLDGKGFRTLQGTMNNLNSVWSEFQDEIRNYQAELRAKGASQATIDAYDVYANALKNKSYELLLSTREANDVLKGALIEAGFGREIKQQNAQPGQAQTKKILDWKKLAGVAGDIQTMKDNVSRVLLGKGFSQAEVDRINDSLLNEYNDLRASVIQKATNNLNQRNQIHQGVQKSAAKRLAELYSQGLFNATPNTYDHLLNNLFGLSNVDQATFSKLKVMGQALETLYSTRLNGQKLNEDQLKTAINTIGEQIQEILHAHTSDKSTFLRIVRGLQLYMEAAQRMVLNSLKNAFLQNPLSGMEARMMGVAGYNKSSTEAMRAQQRQIASATFHDIVSNQGVPFGDVNSVFVNRGSFDNLVNSVSDNKNYHRVASVLIGRMGLDALDSFYKVSLVEKKFASALIKVLTADSNPNKMSRDQAIQYVAQQTTGQSFENAKTEAAKAISAINQQAGKRILSDDQASVLRLANDMIKAALITGGKMTEKEVTAAYNSAYRAAGRDLGHVANNQFSEGIQAVSTKNEEKIAKAIKDKNYHRASILTLQSIFFRNILNPFVGGATNWIFLKISKVGFGVVSGGLNMLHKGEAVDLSTDFDMKKLEEQLYDDFKAKDQVLRGAIGGLAGLALTLLAANVLPDCNLKLGSTSSKERAAAEAEDCYGAWRRRNRWVSRYIDEITPEPYLAAIAMKGGQMKNYVANLIGKNDDFSSTNLIFSAMDKYAKGDKHEAYGLFGQAVGQKFNVPLPWRLTKDVWTIGQGITGKPTFQFDFTKPKSLWEGATRGGLLEFLGFNYEADYALDALPGVSQKTLDKLHSKGIDSISDLKKRSVRGLKYKGKHIFKKDDAKKIIDILKEQEDD